MCTYFLHRPCVYCSILLIILFLTSCNWSDRCFFDFSSNWFLPRPSTTDAAAAVNGSCPAYNSNNASMSSPTDLLTGASDPSFNATVFQMLNVTARGLVSAAADKYVPVGSRPEWTGLGLGWLRNLLGQREWRIECMDLYIRL